MPPYCKEHAMFHSYYGEHGDMRRAALAAERDAERRERAAQIAEDIIGDAAHGSSLLTAEDLRAALTAAALQALTEKENAR